MTSLKTTGAREFLKKCKNSHKTFKRFVLDSLVNFNIG